MLTRRHFILSATASCLSLPAWRTWATTTLKAGNITLDTVSDGNLVLPQGFIFSELPATDVDRLKTQFNLAGDTLAPPCNVTLLRDGTNTVLFDVGAGQDFQSTAGRLPEALGTLGLSVEDVTHVVFTHGHPDHLWGLLDEFDEPLFPGASFLMGEQEFAYWTNPETVNSIGAERSTFAVGAARRLAVIADSIKLLGDGDKPVDGVTARLTPGHTPGHLAFEIDTPEGPVLVVGDAIGNHHMAFAYPGSLSSSDQDPALAARTRLALMDQLASANTRLIGFHLPEGGIGRVVQDGAAYRFEPQV
ncbi:MBL fold metallo-hydrolase [Pannonibacter sp.]|uniref:MBL fold metallo-hydrolase n=1 Tax=Pannonibacter sp. TaxID=1906786 RepID=UPI003F6EC83A